MCDLYCIELEIVKLLSRLRENFVYVMNEWGLYFVFFILWVLVSFKVKW